jgi:hypothetical protein
MSGKPWLSVLMPLHEGAQWIGETLESVATQAAGIEIIAIDSSPDEKTAKIVESFSHRLDLKLIRRPDLKPWTVKTNLAAEMARADHIVMLHQDDLWLPGRAAEIRRWIEAAPAACLHLAPTAILDKDGRILGRWRCPLKAGPVRSDALLERLLVQNFVSVPAPVIRRDAWLAVGGMDVDLWYTADWDLWLKLAGQSEVHYHPEVTTGFRVHGASLTMSGSRASDDFRSQMKVVLDRHLPLLSARTGRRVRKLAEASITINCALARLAAGSRLAFLPALAALVRLGPAGVGRYLRFSRILERSLPRLRASLAGAL